MLRKILILSFCLNLISSLISLGRNKKQKNEDHLRVITTFEELDQIMFHSEFNEIWKKVRNNIKNGKMDPELEEEFEKMRPKEMRKKDKEENYDDELDYDLILGSSSDSCLLSKEKTTEILERDYGIIDNDPKEEMRFIVGKCHPVVLVPGMLSTKLQVRINCANLFSEEFEIYKKIKFYCGKEICSSIESNPYEEHDLFISGTGVFQLLLLGETNKYSACLGYFLTFFNTKDACAPDTDEGHDKYVCNYSKNIKIGYYGSGKFSQKRGKCGLSAIQNVIMVGGMDWLENEANKDSAESFGPLIQQLEGKGYKPGFSLGAVPNDYRKFLANNIFTANAIRYQIENLYKNTGKSVVIVAHSYGTNTILENLVKEENSDILPKIKKFVAVGPPFAGSAELITRFFESDQFSKTITYSNIKLKAELDKFGWGMIINTLPIAIELRPLPIIGELLNNPEYKELGDAIKERLYLEKECGYQLCDDDKIKKYSVKFDSLFKGYYPSLTEPVCKFESIIAKNTDYFNRKCLSEIYNIGDCPTIIEAKKDALGNLPNDFESYCGKSDDNLYFQQECNSNGRKCLDEAFFTKLNYPFEESEKTKYFIERWYKNYNEHYGEIDGMNEFPSREKYLSSPKKQIEFYNEISSNKKLLRPPVDTDIVYSVFEPTVAAFIYNENDFSTDGKKYHKGGDGDVPTWSPIITGLKWIYETKKNNLKNKIRFVQYCSRLGKNSDYAYDAEKDQDYVALSCKCINNSNNYHKSSSCSHSQMINDPYFFHYVFTVINDPKEKNIVTEDKYEAVNNFNKDINYENECNAKLLEILDSDI